MVGFQVVLRAVDDRILAPTVAARRAFAGVVRRIGRPRGLYGFGLADTHGHAVLICDAPALGRFVHDVRLSLTSTLELPIAEADVRKIRDTWHAESLVRYVHRQDVEHGANLDPLREGTSLPDLLGLRPSGLWMADRLRVVAPRVGRVHLLEHWGISKLEEAFDLDALADSGAAAIGRGDLRGNTPDAVAARIACVHAGTATTAELADALSITTRSVRELRLLAPDPKLVRAVRLQMGLRAAIEVLPAFVRDSATVDYQAWSRVDAH
jgi:hypothetical protein